MRMFPRFIAAALLVAVSASYRSAHADTPSPAQGSLLLLHYRWHHDTLSLVDSRRIQAAVKKSRSLGRGNPASRPDPWAMPRTPFSYELVGGDGSTLAVRYLQDPGIKRVEVQGPGERQLRQEILKLDSADIFLRVPEAEARSIRFYRHAKAGADPAANPAAARPTVAKPGTAGSGAGAALGPQPAPVKTLLAEFPLE